MGLNLETLIGILVILILLILADGVRRMIRERHGRLRMRIDRRFRRPTGEEDEEDDFLESNPEVIGRPRVVSRGADGAPLPEDREDPPIMMEEDDPLDEDGRRAEQQNLFDDEPEMASDPDRSREEGLPSMRASREPPEDELEAEPQPAGEAPRTRSEARQPRREAPPPDRQVQEVIVFHLISRRPDRFDGEAMLRYLLECGLRFGEMNIFHRHREGDEYPEFSVANAVEPGTFDIQTMEEQEFAGITFFMQLPGPQDPLASLDRMLTTGRRMAEGLYGDLRDEQHSVLTPQTMEHLRQRVQEFERRQRVSHSG
ncbi:cell division protein ZipA [Alcanivorax xiamenensis]|uniref:Cell division protein ZipA n=1 Tax=Alcanivorax xiamenensis TaxID=1177156 RepID=A0ABQ6Y4Z7_9GAMM|nr:MULTISPECIES: cell division protein ZipA [Alcanivorax]KAF0804234.1 cell division protein ZipA [Alcanivorax xiamenensis]